MGASYYALASGNLTPLATLSVQTGTPDTDYPASNLGILNPAKPARISSTTGAWLAAFDEAKCLEAVAVIHHNFLNGTTVLKIQANSSDSWGSPPLDVTMSIMDDDADNYPRNPYIDLRLSIPVAANRTYQYWRLSIASNPVNIAVGELLLIDSLKQFERNLLPGMGDEEQQPIIEHRTDHGVSTIYHLGPKWRRWTGELVLEQTSAVAAFRTLYQDTRGRARGFLFIPDPTVNDAWFARFDDSKYVAARHAPNMQKLTVGFEEISRGLYL